MKLWVRNRPCQPCDPTSYRPQAPSPTPWLTPTRTKKLVHKGCSEPILENSQLRVISRVVIRYINRFIENAGVVNRIVLEGGRRNSKPKRGFAALKKVKNPWFRVTNVYYKCNIWFKYWSLNSIKSSCKRVIPINQLQLTLHVQVEVRFFISFYFHLLTIHLVQSYNVAFLFAKCSDSVLHRWLHWVPLGLIISWLTTKRRHRRAAVIVVYSSAVRSADGRCFLTAEVELRAMVSPPAVNRDALRAMSATRHGSCASK